MLLSNIFYRNGASCFDVCIANLSTERNVDVMHRNTILLDLKFLAGTKAANRVCINKSEMVMVAYSGFLVDFCVQ